MRCLRLSKNLFVGAGVLDGPFEHVTNSPEVERKHSVLLPGRRGRRPLRFEFRAFLTCSGTANAVPHIIPSQNQRSR